MEGLLLVGTGFQLGIMKRLWKWIIVMIVHFECTKSQPNCTPKMTDKINLMYSLP